MIKGGKGGANTNKSGLKFERETSLAGALVEAGFMIRGHEVWDEFEIRGELIEKHKLYRFLELRDIRWSERVSTKLLPDECFFNVATDSLHVVEKKYQSISGSTDEKLQTVPFKLRQYNRLVEGTGIEVKFIYILNDWFRQKQYRDVLHFIEDCGATYHFADLPLSELGL